MRTMFVTVCVTLLLASPAWSQSDLTVTRVAPAHARQGRAAVVEVIGGGFDSLATLSLERAGSGSVWTPAASMSTIRTDPSAVRLTDGRVLVAGGKLAQSGWRDDGPTLSSTEIFDPSTGQWSAAAPMLTACFLPVLVLLTDGRVLAAGGGSQAVLSLDASEIYDPVTDTWTATPSMTQPRVGAAAVLLSNGKVLAAGGWNYGQLHTTEIFDPATQRWTSGPDMSEPRSSAGIATLLDGRVLVAGGAVAGGTFSSTSQIYDPGTNTWGAPARMVTARYNHGMALLPDGHVVAMGGANGPVISDSEIYDPATDRWTATPPLSGPRVGMAVVSFGGRVMVVGGTDGIVEASMATTEIYDASANAWLMGPTMGTTRLSFAGVTLADGRVLAAGGLTSDGGVATAEILSAPTIAFTATMVRVQNGQHLHGTFNLTGVAAGYWDVVVRDGSRVARLRNGFYVDPR
ncbi:MAG: kelch repeat-containing protein [Planctomycetota bacterium]